MKEAVNLKMDAFWGGLTMAVADRYHLARKAVAMSRRQKLGCRRRLGGPLREIFGWHHPSLC